MKQFVLTIYAFTFFINISFSQSLTKVWSTKEVLKVPECVLYNPDNRLLYVSNINGKPTEKNGAGFITILNEQGKIKNLKWATGLNAPKGMDIKGDRLYVSDIDRLAEIDLNSGEVIRFISFPGAIFLNDVATGYDGKIYVTDTRKGVVYVLKDGKPEIWSSDELLNGVNGITVENGKLLIGTQGYLLKGDTKTGKLNTVVKVPIQIDGLVPLGNGQYVVSAWMGKVLFISKENKLTELMNVEAENGHTADMGYIPAKKLLLIPDFKNKVVAKRVDYK